MGSAYPMYSSSTAIRLLHQALADKDVFFYRKKEIFTRASNCLTELNGILHYHCAELDQIKMLLMHGERRELETFGRF